MNKFLIRNLVIYLVISGTLVSSLAVTGPVYASLNKLPDTNIGPEVGTEDEDQATNEGDNETTSEAPVASQNRFCVDGTGGATGRACVPCDPGLTFEVGCIDILTGGPLDMPETATSDSGKSAVKGELFKPESLKMLQDTDSPTKRIEIIFQNLEDKGKVPLQTTQTFTSFLKGDTSAYTLCKKVSEDKSATIGANDCAALQDQGGSPNTANIVGPFLLGWLIGEMLNAGLKDAGIDVTGPITCATFGLGGSYPTCTPS